MLAAKWDKRRAAMRGKNSVAMRDNCMAAVMVAMKAVVMVEWMESWRVVVMAGSMAAMKVAQTV